MTNPEEPMSEELELAGRVVQELGPAAREFAAQVTGSATHELGEALADRARLRRFRGQVKILSKAQEAAARAGLPASVVPVKVLAPLLDFAALEEEDDEDMAERWANLLANAATNSAAEVPPAFPDILRQLEPVEAGILDLLFESRSGESGTSRPYPLDQLAEAADLPAELITQARIGNLVRLGLAAHPLISVGGAMLGAAPQVPVDRSTIEITALGAEFVRACRPPERSDAPPA